MRTIPGLVDVKSSAEGGQPEKQVEFLSEIFAWIEAHLDEGLQHMKSSHGGK